MNAIEQLREFKRETKMLSESEKLTAFSSDEFKNLVTTATGESVTLASAFCNTHCTSHCRSHCHGHHN